MGMGGFIFFLFFFINGQSHTQTVVAEIEGTAWGALCEVMSTSQSVQTTGSNMFSASVCLCVRTYHLRNILRHTLLCNCST